MSTVWGGGGGETRPLRGLKRSAAAWTWSALRSSARDVGGRATGLRGLLARPRRAWAGGPTGTRPWRGHGDPLRGRRWPDADPHVRAAGTAFGQAPGLAAGRARAWQRPTHGTAARPGAGGSGQAHSARPPGGARRGSHQSAGAGEGPGEGAHQALGANPQTPPSWREDQARKKPRRLLLGDGGFSAGTLPSGDDYRAVRVENPSRPI
jgi:hypothetical protein